MISASHSRMGHGLGQTGTAKLSCQKSDKSKNKITEIHWISVVLSILDKKDATIMSQSNTFEVFYNLRA